MGRGDGHGGESGKGASNQKRELLIDGRMYDITDFAGRHPGGSIIKFLEGGEDATAAFKEFHNRSTKASKTLNALPSREVDQAPPVKVSSTSPVADPAVRAELMRDFKTLRESFEAEGLFDPSPLHVVYRLAELLVMHVIGFWLVANGWEVVGAAFLGISNGRCGWLMHEAGHKSLTGHLFLDTHLQAFLYGLGNGMSGSYWNNQHNKHHCTPQKLRHDVDLETLPLVAFNRAIAERAKGPGKLWLKLQAALFTPVVTFLVVAFWVLYLHPRHALRTRNYHELFYMGLRHALSFYFLSLKTFLIIAWVGGMYIFTNFSLSHTHRPVVRDDEHVTWVEYASDYTVNIAPHGFTDWWMGYLNYQIEHHLFPSMPQFRQRGASPRVKAFFEKHGLEYRVLGYFEALKLTLKNLHVVGNHSHGHDE